MGTSWTDTRLKFKSPLWVVARFCWRSREAKTAKCRQLKRKLDDAEATIARQAAEFQRQDEEIRALRQRARRLEEQSRSFAAIATVLPTGKVFPVVPAGVLLVIGTVSAFMECRGAADG